MPHDDSVREGSAVPVLLYHAVTTRPSATIAPFTVTPTDFERQLDAVLEAGFSFVRLQDHLAGTAATTAAAPARGRVAAVTFDDGYADVLDHALPALASRGVPATVYVTTGWVEGTSPGSPGPGDRMLSPAGLHELLAAGVDVGAHSHTHPHLDVLPAAQLHDEVTRPRAVLEDVLQRPVTAFAYPHGYSGPRVRRAVVRAGYTSAASVRDRLSHPGDDPFGVARLMLRAGTTEEQLSDLVTGRSARTAGQREDLRTTAWRGYRRARALVRPSLRTEYR